MKTRLFALGVGAVWGLGLLAPGATALKTPGIINITQIQRRESGSGFRLPGVEHRWVYELHNYRITRAAIGYSILSCTYIGQGGSLGNGVSDCAAIYSLANGKIVARGIVKQRSYYGLAVVGGTGIYSNVGGQVLVSTIRERPHVEHLVFGLEL